MRDVFRAAVGHILPDELKGEVRSLYESPFVCTDHRQDCELLAVDGRPDLVTLHTTMTRTFKNVTSTNQEFDANVSVTEWLHGDQYASHIVDIGSVLGDKRMVERGPLKREKGLNTVSQSLKEKIVVAPGQALTMWHETVETKRSSDVSHFVFLHPTKDSQVAVRGSQSKDDPLVVNVRSSCRHRDKVDCIGTNTQRMRGTLLAYQGIEIRWFRSRDYDAWVKDASSGEG